MSPPVRARQLPAQLYRPRCRCPRKQQRCIIAAGRSNGQAAPLVRLLVSREVVRPRDGGDALVGVGLP